MWFPVAQHSDLIFFILQNDHHSKSSYHLPLYIHITVLFTVFRTVYFPGGASGKESAYQFRRCNRHRFYPWVRKVPWRKDRQSTPVLLPGESHPRDRGAWGLQSLGLQSQTWLKWLSLHSALCTSSPWLICFVAGSLYLLISLSYLSPLWQPPVSSVYL